MKLRLGLGLKVVGTSALITLLLSAVLSVLAWTQLDRALSDSFESKGEAIALSLASAAEQNASGVSALQSSIDSNKVIAGVRYIYLQDADHSILVHTFTPQFPAGMEKLNQLQMGESSAARRVKVAPELFLEGDFGRIEAIDVAAPISGGALGFVHVGMDRGEIRKQVSALRLRMISWGLGIALLGIALFALFTNLGLLRPIRALTQAAQEILRKGDLTQAIESTSNDELGELAQTFRAMVDKLREALTNLKESSGALGESMGELSANTAEQNRTITRQATALQETQVTAQEIKQTSALAAQKAEVVLERTEKAEQVSRLGAEAIAQSFNGLSDIREQVDQLATRIGDLSARTAEIAGITQTVKDLADQSNMLALNAAIEAVRSGEHGKGFAVVAREIRSLADQSIEATRRVREVLDSIAASIRGLVGIAQAGSQRIEGALEQIRSSGDSLKALSGIVKESSSSVRQIAAAVSQQNAGIGQIFSAVTDLSGMMEETVQRLEATSGAAARLESISSRAAVVVGSYRV